MLIISGIYTVSQNISGLEIEVGKGGMTSVQALEKANAFTAQVQPRQTLLLRIGMVVIPVLALTCAYVLIRKSTKLRKKPIRKWSRRSRRDNPVISRAAASWQPPSCRNFGINFVRNANSRCLYMDGEMR